MPKNNPNCPLPDIREARIDPTLPVNERLRLFAAAIGDPHRFRVGDTEVEVLFDDSGNYLGDHGQGLCIYYESGSYNSVKNRIIYLETCGTLRAVVQ